MYPLTWEIGERGYFDWLQIESNVMIALSLLRGLCTLHVCMEWRYHRGINRIIEKRKSHVWLFGIQRFKMIRKLIVNNLMYLFPYLISYSLPILLIPPRLGASQALPVVSRKSCIDSDDDAPLRLDVLGWGCGGKSVRRWIMSLQKTKKF